MTATPGMENETVFQRVLCERIDAWRALPECAEITLADWLLEAGIVVRRVARDPDAMRKAQKQQNKNYAASAMLVCISLADEVVCAGGSAADVAASLRERISAPVPSPDGAGEQLSFDELTRIRERMDCIEAHADEGGTGSAANLQEMVGYVRRLVSVVDDFLQGFGEADLSPATGAAEPPKEPT